MKAVGSILAISLLAVTAAPVYATLQPGQTAPDFKLFGIDYKYHSLARHAGAKAYVVLKEGETATEPEIIDFCRERIAKYKAPRAVEFRNTLPTTPTGKILKRALRQEVLAAGMNNVERR